MAKMARIARATGAVVVPCITRQEGCGYVTRFYPAWDNIPTDDVAADTRRMNAHRGQPDLELAADDFLADRDRMRRRQVEGEFSPLHCGQQRRFFRSSGQESKWILLVAKVQTNRRNL